MGIKGVSWDDPDEGAIGVDGSPALYKKLTMTKDREYYGNMNWGQIFPMFLTAEHQFLYLSSSAVKELARYDADVSDFLPAAIIPDFKARMMEQI